MFTLKLKVILTATALTLATVCIYYSSIKDHLSSNRLSYLQPQSDLFTVSHTALQNTPLNFVYLIQTESCLSDYLKSLEVIGNTTACQCDVLVLSYKDKCTDSSLPHVQYIFDSSTTWTTGRNLLYKTVMERGHRYLYYTFMDDDVVLKFSDSKTTNGNPWREFEASVLREQPPIVAGFWRLPPLRARAIKKCHNKGFKYFNEVDFMPVTSYDAMFNSFHYKAIDHLLPYYDKLDSVSWWFSQLYMTIKSDILFHNQVHLLTKIVCKNTAHRKYPRDSKWENVISQIVQDIRQKLPQNVLHESETMLDNWRVNFTQKTNKRFSLCLPSSFQLQHSPIMP